jgi:hypothetical protein
VANISFSPIWTPPLNFRTNSIAGNTQTTVFMIPDFINCELMLSFMHSSNTAHAA